MSEERLVNYIAGVADTDAEADAAKVLAQAQAQAEMENVKKVKRQMADREILEKAQRDEVFPYCDANVAEIRNGLALLSQYVDVDEALKIDFNEISPFKFKNLEEQYRYVSLVVDDFARHVNDYRRNESLPVGDVAAKCKNQLPVLKDILKHALGAVSKKSPASPGAAKKVPEPVKETPPPEPVREAAPVSGEKKVSTFKTSMCRLRGFFSKIFSGGDDIYGSQEFSSGVKMLRIVLSVLVVLLLMIIVVFIGRAVIGALTGTHIRYDVTRWIGGNAAASLGLCPRVSGGPGTGCGIGSATCEDGARCADMRTTDWVPSHDDVMRPGRDVDPLLYHADPLTYTTTCFIGGVPDNIVSNVLNRNPANLCVPEV